MERIGKGYISHYVSPLGNITLGSDGEHLTGLWFDGQRHFAETLGESCEEKEIPVFVLTKKWLDIYFTGKEPGFRPKVEIRASEFQRQVLAILSDIPYGHTVTYGKIAEKIASERGIPKMSARAVGNAVGRNPVSLIIPCHRVIRSVGYPGEYAGGAERKAKLLELEGALRYDH